MRIRSPFTVTSVALAAVGLLTGQADATAPPAPPAPTAPPYGYDQGTLAAADGSFSVAFATPPVYTTGDDSSVTYRASIDEDVATVEIKTPDAWGTTPDTGPAQYSSLWLDSHGDSIEPLANTTTGFGPFPANVFVAELTVHDGPRAVAYGVTVLRDGTVTTVTYLDAGLDDTDAARAFVDSYTLMTAALPLAPVAPAPTVSGAPAESATADATATPGATIAFDGRWSVSFPEDAPPAFSASLEDGFVTVGYLADAGDDELSVTVTEVPAGYEWATDHVPGFADAAFTATQRHVGAADAFEASFEWSSGAVTALVVNADTQIVTVSYLDGGATSEADASAFTDSFSLN